MATAITTLKSYFENGKKPTQQEFAELIDAFVHRNDDLQSLLGAIAEVIEAEEGVVNDKYMTPFLTKKAIEALVRLSVLTDLAADVQGRIDTAINALVNSAPGALDTLGEIAQALGNDQGAYNSLLTAINNRYTKTELDAFFEGTASGKKQVNWNRVTGKPSTFAPSSHHHDERYYTEAEVNDLLAGKEPAFNKNTAFNKDLGTGSGQVAEGNNLAGGGERVRNPDITLTDKETGESFHPYDLDLFEVGKVVTMAGGYNDMRASQHYENCPFPAYSTATVFTYGLPSYYVVQTVHQYTTNNYEIKAVWIRVMNHRAVTFGGQATPWGPWRKVVLEGDAPRIYRGTAEPPGNIGTMGDIYVRDIRPSVFQYFIYMKFSSHYWYWIGKEAYG